MQIKCFKGNIIGEQEGQEESQTDQHPRTQLEPRRTKKVMPSQLRGHNEYQPTVTSTAGVWRPSGPGTKHLWGLVQFAGDRFYSFFKYLRVACRCRLLPDNWRDGSEQNTPWHLRVNGWCHVPWPAVAFKRWRWDSDWQSKTSEDVSLKDCNYNLRPLSTERCDNWDITVKTTELTMVLFTGKPKELT